LTKLLLFEVGDANPQKKTYEKKIIIFFLLLASSLNVPFHMRPGLATGVGSVTEDLDLAIEEEEKRSLKDVSTARRKRRLRFRQHFKTTIFIQFLAKEY